MAKALIESMTSEWEPTKQGSIQAALMELIEEGAEAAVRKAGRARVRRMWWISSLSSSRAWKVGTRKTESKGQTGSDPQTRWSSRREAGGRLKAAFTAIGLGAERWNDSSSGSLEQLFKKAVEPD
jgi:hypothetical protein